MNGPVIDVSELQKAAFGHRALLWWGTLGFMAIEGTTLATVTASYLYARHVSLEWPPPPTPLPDLLVPTLGMAVLALMILPMRLAAKRAEALDARKAVTWLLVSSALGVVAVALRALEFDAVNTRWDDHAYGSLVWTVLGMHATLLLVDVFEGTAIALFLAWHPDDPHAYADVSDASFYQYFLTGTWVPLYGLLYWLPRT